MMKTLLSLRMLLVFMLASLVKTRTELLEAWLAVNSVNYHRNIYVSVLLNQWLVLTNVNYHRNI